MGIVYSGIPQQLALELARCGNCGVFIESGTCQGRTAQWAADNFQFVFTIERAQNLYAQAAHELKPYPHVEVLCGDSRQLLPPIVNGLKDIRALYWLDAHWSGEGTAGEDFECPLLEELSSLAGRPDDIILIDDARLFLSAPPKPHRPQAWPTLPELIRLACPDSSRFMQVVDDVIAIVPNRPELVSALTQYAQQRAGAFWQAFGQLQRTQVAA